MKSNILSPGIIHLTTDDQYELSATFMRLQEFYESAHGLRGKYFTYEECMDVYAANQQRKEFTYNTDWAGFNVPGNVVDQFTTKFKKDLLVKEHNMLNIISDETTKPNGRYRKKYYVIGTYACLDSSGYVYHEQCHAFWYLYPEFKKASMELIKKLPVNFRKSIRASLVRDGYDVSVLDDETNAYLATSDMYYIKDVIVDGYKAKTFPWRTIYQLQKNFYEFQADVSE